MKILHWLFILLPLFTCPIEPLNPNNWPFTHQQHDATTITHMGLQRRAATLARIVRYQTCAIELLKAGDFVLTRDEYDADGELVLQRIEETFIRTAYQLQIVTIRSSNGTVQTLHTTAEHPVYALGKGWIACGQIAPGDRLQEPNGDTSTILSARHEIHREGIPVYNFRVNDAHTYFVREQGSPAEPVWVHNACTIEDARNAAARHGGEEIGDGRFQFPTRVSARRAASELAGDLGFDAKPIRLSEFEGGPWWTRNSNTVIGRQSSDETIGWRDDFLGHPSFGAGPHVNVWGPGGAEFHLFY